MTALVTKHLPLVAGAPDGVKNLRALVLELAVRGKLVAQDASDTTADSLLADIRIRLEGKSSSARTRKSLISAPIDVDEWPFALPSSWRWARFSEITSYVQRGKGPIYADRSQYPVISQKCVRWTGLDLSQARHIEPSSIDRYEEVRHLLEGDILWNSTGTGTIGRACVAKSTVPGQVLVADSHVTVVRCEGVLPEYLWRWIQTPTVQDQIENSASGSTNQIELNTSTVLAHLAPIPPLAEQHRIVAKVDELMALCDRLEVDQADAEAAHAQIVQALLDSLTQATDATDFRASWQRLSEHFHTLFTTEASIDALKQAVLQLAVMGKLAGQRLDDEPAEILLSRIQDYKNGLVAGGALRKQRPPPEIDPASVPYELPRGWTWVRWESVTLKIGDIDHKMPETTTDGIPFVSPRDFYPGNVIDFEGAKRVALEDYARLSAKIKAERGDLIYPRYGTIGENVIVDVDRDFLVSYSCAVIKLAKGFIDPMYQYYYSLSACVRRQAKAAENKTTQANVGIKSIQEYLFPLPPLAEQHRIVAKVDELMALCDQLKAQMQQSRQQHAQLASVLVEQAVA